MSIDWDQIKPILDKEDRFLVTSHVRPEGDALGSSVALKLYLESLGKEAYLIHEGESAEQLNFLDKGDFRKLKPGSKEDVEFIQSFPVIFIVDVSDWSHMGNLKAPIQSSKAVKICIDHHLGEGKFADYDLIDPKGSATGLLLYQMIKHFGGTVTEDMATAIYTAIITDTGQFSFQNTSAEAVQVASELLKLGISHYQVYQDIYENNRWEKLRLMEKALSTLTCEADGAIAWMKITHQMFKDTGAYFVDAEGFVDELRAIKGVQFALLFRELEDGSVRINFRSKPPFAVNHIAEHFGGGGHKAASGALCKEPLDEVIEKVVKKIKEEIK